MENLYKRTEINQKVVHSPSMCNFKGETFLTFYECHHEGWTQQVVVLKKGHNGWERILVLPKGTGNPVLVPVKDKLYLAYSQFKPGTENVKSVLFLWKNVDMFVSEIIAKECAYLTKIPDKPCIEYNYINVSFFQNLCPRVSGLEFSNNQSTLLPVYDESFGAGYVIVFSARSMEGKEDQYLISRHSMMYNKNTSLIQPSLFIDNGIMKYEARNFDKNRGTYGISGIWDHHSFTWSVDRRTDIKNYRESVLIFKWGDVNYRVYGASANRTELSISELGGEKVVKLNKLQHGCYPNYLINSDGSCDICFTEYNSKLSDRTNIKILTINKSLEILNEESIQ